MSTPSLTDDYLNGRDIERQIDYLRIGNDHIENLNADDLRKYISGDLILNEDEPSPLEAVKDTVRNEGDIDALENWAEHVGSWAGALDGIFADGEDFPSLDEERHEAALESIRAYILAHVETENEALDFCDEFDVAHSRQFNANIDDEDELNELADWLDFMEQAESHGGGSFRNMNFISDGKWVDYCREMAGDCGDIDLKSHMADFINWDEYAESLKPDYAEIEVNGNIFFVRC